MTLKRVITSKVPAYILVLVILLAVVGLILWQGSRKPESSTVNGDFLIDQVSADISQEKQILVSLGSGEISFDPGEAIVFIPAGAFEKAGKIVLTQREADLLSEVGEPGWRRPYVVNIEYQDALGNVDAEVDLHKPVEVCFLLDDDLWEEYLHGVRFRVEVYAETQNPPVWEALPLFAYDNRSQLCGTSGHLSLFALAVNDVSIPIPTSTPGVYNP